MNNQMWHKEICNAAYTAVVWDSSLSYLHSLSLHRTTSEQLLKLLHQQSHKAYIQTRGI